MAGLNFGSVSPSALKVGPSSVSKLYLGSTKIYEAVAAIPPPLMYLPMEEFGTSVAIDATGNGHSATLSGSSAGLTTPGLQGMAGLELLGGLSYAVVAGGAWINVPSFSITQLVKSTSSANGWKSIGDRDNGSSRCFQYAVGGDGSILFIQTSAGTRFGQTLIAPAGSVPLNQRCRMALTFDATNGRVSMYVNGVLKATDVGFNISGTSPLAFGGSYGGGSSPTTNQFLGQIDEVRYYDYALTPQQVSSELLLDKPQMTVRENLIPNPSFETNLTGWGTFSATSSRVANTIGGEGSWMAEIVGNGGDSYIEPTTKPLLAGNTYTVSALGMIAADHDASAGRSRRINVFYNVGGYTEVASPPLTTTPGRVSVTVTIPQSASDTIIRLQNGSTTGKKVWWDDVLVEKVSSAGSYFSGATVNTATKQYLWRSTPHASASLEFTQPTS